MSVPRAMRVVGSPEWCWQTLAQLKIRFSQKADSAAMFEQTLRELEEARAWEVIPRERPFGSEEAMLRTELGVATPADARARKREQTMADQAELDGKTIHAGDGPLSRAERDNLHIMQVTTDGGHGTRADYLARRIARDFPEIHEAVKAGEYRSIHAAAVAAGIVKPTITLPLDPQRAVRLLAKHFTLESLVEHWPQGGRQ